MPMALGQIVAEASHLPTEQVVELVDRLSQGLHLSPGIEENWKAETRQRVGGIEAAKVQGIPGPEVSARIRKAHRALKPDFSHPEAAEEHAAAADYSKG